MHVIKRDGTLAVFNPQKIFDAVYKACKATKKDTLAADIAITSRTVSDSVTEQCSQLEDQEHISVEQIQDMVESQLMDVDKDIAKNYILYRQHRSETRQMKSGIFTTIEQFMTPDIEDMDDKRENANIDGGSTMGAMLKIGGTATKTFNLTKLISPKYAQMHREGKWHIHDLDFLGLTVNCCYIPADKLLDNGFSTGHGSLRTPSTIGTAATQAAIIIQSDQNDLFGGQAIPNFDYALAPYVAKSYVRNCMLYLGIKYNITKDTLKEYLEKPLFEYIKQHRHILTNEGYAELNKCIDKLFEDQNISDELDIEKMKAYALEKTDNDTYQAMEGMIHNFCSLASRAGSQVPFSSINYGTDTTEEGRMVIKNVLLATKAGLGNGETAIFPISIFRMRKGITDKGSPNYDLFKLSCEVSAQRLFPNFLNTSSSFNDPYVKEGDPRTLVATMGCLDYDTVITVKNSNDRLWSLPIGKFVQLPDATKYKVWDTYHNTFATIKNVIINPPVFDWLRITLSNGRFLDLTSDHRLLVNGKTIYAKDVKSGDNLPNGKYPIFEEVSQNIVNETTSWYWLLGMIIRDGSYTSNIRISVGMDESDLAIAIMTTWTSLQIQSKLIPQYRGIKGNYIDILTLKTGELSKNLAMIFNGQCKIDRLIPMTVFSASYRERMAFLCGMIDADGYINNRNGITRIQIGSTNKSLSLQTFMLAQGLGLKTTIYASHYGRGDRLVYRVEIQPTVMLVDNLRCSKKRIALDTCRGVTRISNQENLTVLKVEVLNTVMNSYCLETDTDMFDANGVCVHNCRTRVLGNVHDPNNEISYGRGNLFMVTLNLPYYALEAVEYCKEHPDTDKITKFYEIFDERIQDAFGQLDERFEIVAKRKAKNYPFLMGQHVYLGSEKLHPDDEIREVLKQGTLTIGFIGLAETLVALVGKHHGESKTAWELGYQIISHLNDACKAKSDETKMNYSCMGTPAEGCCGRLLKAVRKRFGTIKGISDHEYLSNSHHRLECGIAA